jgi:hypothetical protein
MQIGGEAVYLFVNKVNQIMIALKATPERQMPFRILLTELL